MRKSWQMPDSTGSKPARVALYARYSSDRQSEHSVEDQLRICHVQAEQNGCLIVQTSQDVAISGSTTLRPGYQALQTAMRGGEGDGLLRNRAYLGEIRWNRRHRVIDPQAGQRHHRPNPVSLRVTSQLPEFRLINDHPWNRVEKRLAVAAAPKDAGSGRPRALEAARALILEVTLHPAPRDKAPKIGVEGHLARMLTAAQPSLPESAAIAVASAGMPVKERQRAKAPR